MFQVDVELHFGGRIISVLFDVLHQVKQSLKTYYRLGPSGALHGAECSLQCSVCVCGQTR